MYILSSKAKLKVNNIKDALIAKKSHQLAKTSNINAKSTFILLLLLITTVVAIDISHDSILQISSKIKLFSSLTIVEVMLLMIIEVNIRKRSEK
jgi:hypothetical protein